MTSIQIIASRGGRLYSLAVDVEAAWQPLDAADSVEVDLLPDDYSELVLGNEKGWSRYLFPRS